MPDEPVGQPAEGASTPEAPASTFDPSPVIDRVDQLASTVGDLRDGFQQFIQAQQPAPEAQPDPWGLEALYGQEQAPQDPNAFDPFAQQQQAPQIDPNALRQAYQADLQQHLNPLQQELQQFRVERADQRLGQIIPGLANVPEGHPNFQANSENRQKAYELVTRSLTGYPPQIAQALSADPNYIAAQWKAAEADRLAAGQAPASEAVPAIEAAGGAVPGGNGEQPNIAQTIYANREAAMPKGFR